MATDNDDHCSSTVHCNKVTALEVKTTYLEETLKEHSSTLKDIYNRTGAIKSRLDGFNGAIPHIKEGLDELREDFKEFREYYMKEELIDIKEKTESHTKVKLLWAGIGAVLLGLMSILIKLIAF